MVQDWDIGEILDLKASRFLYEVEDKLDFYEIPIEINENQLERLFHDTLKTEDEEIEAPEITRGFAFIRKDATGKYYALKNIKFHLVDFLEAVLALIQAEQRYRLIFAGIFLFKIMQHLGTDLSEEHIAILVVLYQMTKFYEVTDENVMNIIVQGLEENDYCELLEKSIKKKLSELMEMELVSIVDGRYEVTNILMLD